MTTETVKNSICAACPHGLSMHFTNVIGDVVCLVTGISAWGGFDRCDCYNYDSPLTRRRIERNTREALVAAVEEAGQ